MVRSTSVIGCFKMPKRNVKVAPVVALASNAGIFTIHDMSSTSTLDVAALPESQDPAATMQARRHSVWWHVLIDLPILLLVTAACILLELGVVPSRQLGFRCGDPDLAHPVQPDTISIGLIVAITVIVPFICFWVVEATLHRSEEYTLKQSRAGAGALAAAVLYRDYIYGAVLNLAVLELIKCIVGSPRPSFFKLCDPVEARNCTAGTWVSSYTCTSGQYSRYLQIDSGRSFPSGHASLAVYCGLFLAWYLQRRAFSWRNRSALLVPLLQLGGVLLAAGAALSRLVDRRHHWWDVAAGAAMGFATLCYTALVLCKNFSQPAVASSSDISSSDGNNHQSVRRLLSGAPHVAGA